MSLNKPEVLTENVALVRLHHSNALPPLTVASKDFHALIGDATQTIKLEIVQSRAVVLQPNLFGAWRESGDEDEQLGELYKSRLTLSPLPNEHE